MTMLNPKLSESSRTPAEVTLFRISHTELFYFFEGIGMDTCVIPLRHGGLSLVQTTDYIYPIVDDPYMMV